MLTAKQIREKNFKTAKGYDKAEVDEFLSIVSEQFEQFDKKHTELQAKYDTLSKALTYYRELEAALQKTMVIAQKNADDLVDTAKKKSKDITDDANSRAADIISSANDKAEHIESIAKAEALKILAKAQSDYSDVKNKTIELIHQYENYKAQFKRLAMVQFDLINDKSFDINIAGLTASNDALNIDLNFDKLYEEYKKNNFSPISESNVEKNIAPDSNVNDAGDGNILPDIDKENVNDNPDRQDTDSADKADKNENKDDAIDNINDIYDIDDIDDVNVQKADEIKDTAPKKDADYDILFKAQTSTRRKNMVFPNDEEVLNNSDELEELTDDNTEEMFSELDSAFNNVLDKVLHESSGNDSAQEDITGNDDDFIDEPDEDDDDLHDEVEQNLSKNEKIEIPGNQTDLNLGISFSENEDNDLFSIDEDNLLSKKSAKEDDEFIFDDSDADDDSIGITFDFLDK